MATFTEVPVVDLHPWLADASDRHAVAQEVDRVFREVGFMYITGHGISAATRDAAFQAAHQFFGQPAEAKLEVDARRNGSYWGYYADRSESTDPTAPADRKEAFDLHHEFPEEYLADASPAIRRRFTEPNLWPSAMSGFRAAVGDYFDQCKRLAGTLFEIVAVANGLPVHYFRSQIDKPIATMRLLHYPPQPADTGEFGIGAHRDYEAITILALDQVGGLEVRNQSGQWIDVPPIADAFVVNIGEMLQRWTNDGYVATDHRVINRSGAERYSIPLFFATNPDTVLRSWSGEQTYAPISAGQYLVDRLESVYGALEPPTPSGIEVRRDGTAPS